MTWTLVEIAVLAVMCACLSWVLWQNLLRHLLARVVLALAMTVRYRTRWLAAVTEAQERDRQAYRVTAMRQARAEAGYAQLIRRRDS